MACSFCGKAHEGDKVHDNVNKFCNKHYLTCVGDHLRLWENRSYIGCYNINYCPICGRKVKTTRDETISEEEIELVMNALAGHPIVTTSELADRVERILKKYI